MAKTDVVAYHYSFTVALVLGIIGNILVIISILKQKCLLKNNYYVLVLHLAICDLGALIMIFCLMDWHWQVSYLTFNPVVVCVQLNLCNVFKAAGIGLMLVILMLRYRATIHPLKPALSRRKLKVVCGLVYIIGFILVCGLELPFCFVKPLNYYIVRYSFLAMYSIFPTIFMAVVYYKVGRALSKQSKHLKRLCHTVAVSRKRQIRDRRTFLICLATVICYGIGNLPYTVLVIGRVTAEYHSFQLPFWLVVVNNILQAVCYHAANPVIYGILDKQLRTFWKCRKPNPRRPQEQLVQQVGETPL